MFCQDAGVLRFAKYQGLGNDFLVVDGRELAATLSAAAVQRLCDRHHGVGADGILTVWPTSGADARMQVQNADGSEAAMCGNGLRCVARYLHDAGRLAAGASLVTLRVGEGLYRCERRGTDRVRVAMGKALFVHPDLPGPAVELESAGECFLASCVYIGNPHAVVFVDHAEPAQLAEQHGPALEAHPAFPNRVNVSFARPRADGFDVAVFERGVGMTLACGSGASAVAAAAVRGERWPAGRAAVIHLPGGMLSIVVDATGEIWMEGETVRVFSGEVEAP